VLHIHLGYIGYRLHVVGSHSFNVLFSCHGNTEFSAPQYWTEVSVMSHAEPDLPG